MKVLKIEQLINDLKEQDIEVEGLICNRYARGISGNFTLPIFQKETPTLHDMLMHTSYWDGIEDYIVEDNDNE